MPDGIYAGVKWMQAATCNPVLDRVLAESQLEELTALHHPVLASRQGRYLAIPAGLSPLLSPRPWKCAYTTIFHGLGGHPSSLAGKGARVARGL